MVLGVNCIAAILVSANGCSAVGAYNNTGILGTLSPPACFGGGANNGMWFKFIAGGPVVNITVNGGSLASPMVGLFSSTGACLSPFTELGRSNPGGATATLPYSALIAGNTCYICVDGANNWAVGKVSYRMSFEPLDLILEKEARFYLLTDGYADQFGWPKGKKFKCI